jgi:hypothetical protein
MTWRDRFALLIVGALSVCTVGAQGCGPEPIPNYPLAFGGSTGAGGAPATGGGGAAPTRCELSCANLAILGCPEDQTTCARQCVLHMSDGRFSQNLDCRINARTIAEAQACGPASCRE